MALDARLALLGQPAVIQPFDVARPLIQASNLRSAQLNQQLAQEQLGEYEAELGRQNQLRGLFAQGLQQPTGGLQALATGPLTERRYDPTTGQWSAPQTVPPRVGEGLSPALAQGATPPPQASGPTVQQVMAISPKFGLEYQRHQLEQQSVQVDTHLKKMQAVSNLARGILEADLSGGGQAAGQAAYDRARPLLRQIAPELEAQIPSVYTRNGVQQFYDAGIGPLQQLQQSQAALNQQKARLQGQQVPDYGATPTVNAEIFALHGDRLRREGRGPTPQEVQQAQENIAARELKQQERAGFQTTQARLEGEQTFQDQQPASLVLKDQMGHYFDRETATPEKPGQSYKTFRERAAADKTVYLPAEQGKQVFALKQLEPVLKTMKEAVEYAYGPTGPLKDYSRTSATEIPAAMWHQALQTDPKLQGYRRTLESQVQSIVRAFGGRGDFNAQEMEAALGMLPRLGATIGLGLSLGPQYGRGGLGMGVGIRPDIALPDTAGTAQETANQLLGQHRERVQSLMQNPGYKGVPDVQIGAQGPGTPAPATAPPRPTPAPTLTLPPSSPVPGLMPTPAPAPQPVPGRSSALPPDPQTSAAVQPQTMPPTPGLTPGPGGESHRWRWADARPHHGHGSAPSRTGSRATAGTSPRA